MLILGMFSCSWSQSILTREEVMSLSKQEWLTLAKHDKTAFIDVFFNRVDNDHMDWVDDFYTREATLDDPVGSHVGRDSIKAYYQSMYAPVTEIRFEFEEIIGVDGVFFAPWVMKLRSRKLRGGDLIEVHGTSRLEFDLDSHRVKAHRDDFDMGAMVYEHIPVLGAIIRWIKRQF